MRLLCGKGSRPWLTPLALGDVSYGKLKEGFNLLVWKSYDWWATAYNSKNFYACLCPDFLESIPTDCVKVSVTEILGLKPEDKERLSSHALERLNEWQRRILSRVPQLCQLSGEQARKDSANYLDKNEIAEFNKCLADIKRWLSECMDTGDKYFSYAYATWVVTPMFRVECLLTKAYQAKEDEKEWNTAYNAVNPPVRDAKMYFRGCEAKEVESCSLSIGARLIEAR